jgi:hypothetical protein
MRTKPTEGTHVKVVGLSATRPAFNIDGNGIMKNSIGKVYKVEGGIGDFGVRLRVNDRYFSYHIYDLEHAEYDLIEAVIVTINDSDIIRKEDKQSIIEKLRS